MCHGVWRKEKYFPFLNQDFPHLTQDLNSHISLCNNKGSQKGTQKSKKHGEWGTYLVVILKWKWHLKGWLIANPLVRLTHRLTIRGKIYRENIKTSSSQDFFVYALMHHFQYPKWTICAICSCVLYMDHSQLPNNEVLKNSCCNIPF